jgi:hypothetical protein
MHTFRVIHYSVQDDHLHLLVEAEDASALTRGVSGLVIRAARSVNHTLGRSGRVWGTRYHARALTSPREVRHGIVYVLMNRKKHERDGRPGIDPCSSAAWFDGLRSTLPPAPASSPVRRPQTWLARVGWRRHGLIDISETPKIVRRA